MSDKHFDLQLWTDGYGVMIDQMHNVPAEMLADAASDLRYRNGYDTRPFRYRLHVQPSSRIPNPKGE